MEAEHPDKILQTAPLALTQSLDLDKVLETLLDYLARLVPYDSASVMLLQSDTNMVVRAIRGYERWTDSQQIQGTSFNVKTALALNTVLETKAPLVISDTETFPGWQRPMGTEYIRSWMGIPLISGDQILGIYSLDKAIPNFFSEDHIRSAETLSAYAVVAIENAQLFQDLQARELQLQKLVNELEGARQAEYEQRILAEALHDIATRLDSTLDFDDVLERILIHVQTVVPYDAGTIMLIQDDVARVIKARGYAESILGLSLPIKNISNLRRVLESGQPSLIEDTHNSDVWVPNPETSWIRSSLTTAIGADEQIIGFLSLEREIPYAFTREHVNRLQAFADQAGVAIRNARLYEELAVAEEEIRRQKEYFEALFVDSPVAALTADQDTKVVSWNPMAEKLFGYTRDEAIGQHVDELVANDPKIREEATEYTRKVLAEEPVVAVTKRTRKDGSLVDVEVRGLPVIVAGELAGYIAIYHDISELQQALRTAEAANQAKSAFLANVSHELRTPLNAIIGYSEMLMEDAEEEKLIQFSADLAKIHAAGKHLLVLINDILDISKIEIGKVQLYLESFDVMDMLEDVVSTIKPMVDRNGNRLEVKTARNLGKMYSDLTKVRQSLYNLLSNAAKFTEEGSITLEATRRAVHGADWFTFRVRDTGIGMTPEQLKVIFRPFAQANEQTALRYGGTGLGLAITKRFCEMLGGEVRVESTYTHGSSFTVQLPAEFVTHSLSV